LRLSAEQASDRAKRDPEFATRSARDAAGWLGTEPQQAFLVGDWYAFLRFQKAETQLEGYYVNGNSGDVEYRRSPWALMGAASKTRRYAKPSDWTSIEKISIPD
jgi:hypothetical protein